jgi:hypothetical protein
LSVTSAVAKGVAPFERIGHPRARAAVAWVESQALLIMALCAIAVFSLAKLPQHITQDTWLALVDGRYIAAHGIPHHDTLYVLTHGARWIDQQWLAQLILYGLNQIGGLALYGILYAALTVVGFALAIAAARRLGGSERHVLWTLPLTGALYFAGSFNVRTQGLALPLFSATLWLLAREISGARDRRVYIVFPLLILWGNLHGSVTLGVGLTMLCGVVLIARDLGENRWRAGVRRVRARGVVLLIGAPVCLLLNPYGFEIIRYYRETILNPAFGKVVVEWQPITTEMVLAIPFFLLAFGTTWVMGRAGRRMPAFDQLALIVLGAGAVWALRNITWYGMAVTILLPRTLTMVYGAGREADRRARLNLALVGVSLLVLLATALAVATRPSSWFERNYSARALSAVASIARSQPSTRIYADNRFADWLLWKDPSLAGRIDYDIRFELLTVPQLNEIINVTSIPRPHEAALLPGYGLLVLDPTAGSTTQRLLARPGTHVVLRSKTVDVATWVPTT